MTLRPVDPPSRANSDSRSDAAIHLAGCATAALLAVALVIAPAAAPSPAAIPVASAACPGAEVVFARGREEPPGVGFVGDALVDSLRAKVHMPVGAYGIIPLTSIRRRAPTI
jgi:cutinase